MTLLDVFRQGGKLYLCFEYLEKTGGGGVEEKLVQAGRRLRQLSQATGERCH